MIEHYFQCPYCFEQISILIEPLPELQHYIEDCEVCCNPIQFEILANENEIRHFSAEILGQ